MPHLSIDDVDELRRAAAAAATQSGALDQARESALRSARDAEDEARRLVLALRQRAGQARSALAACDSDDPARGHLQVRVRTAENSLQRGEALARATARRVADLHRYAATQAQRQHRLVDRLAAVHAALVDDIDRARGILAQRNATAAPSQAQRGRIEPIEPTAGIGAAAPSVGGTGTALVPLAGIEARIEHVRGPEDFSKMSMSDMRIALNILEARVLPAVRSGATRDDLADLDQARGLAGATVTHAGVYDLFFGDDRIRLSRAPDGSFSITNGAHRIWLARQMGITELPADTGPAA